MLGEIFFRKNLMIKYFLSIFISLLFFNQTFAKDVSINENIDLKFVCDLDKKIIKNSEYNYQTFLAKDLNEKGCLLYTSPSPRD